MVLPPAFYFSVIAAAAGESDLLYGGLLFSLF